MGGFTLVFSIQTQLLKRTVRNMVKIFAVPIALSFLLLDLAPSSALDNGLALRPPMGWLSWLWLGCEVDCDKHPTSCLSEDVIKTTADRMAADGFKEAGYEYIIIDDCWLERDRSADGKMVPDRKRFKSGMKALSDYIHSKGLKFGMYQDIGNYTCQKGPGLRGHEKVDIATLVEWEIDYLKVDGCFELYADMNVSYPALGKILNETGRPILYSCSWPAYVPGKNKDYKAMEKNCNIWRNYEDISASWSSLLNIMDWFGSQPELADYAGPGHWHDPDMLVIGNSPITYEQAKAQIAVWCVLAAPLLISADLTRLSDQERGLLLNPNVLAIAQSTSQMGTRLNSSDDLDIWRRPLSNVKTVFAFVNRGPNKRTYEVLYSDLGLDDKTDYTVQNLFYPNQEPMASEKKIHLTIPGTGALFYAFSLTKGLTYASLRNIVDVDSNIDRYSLI